MKAVNGRKRKHEGAEPECEARPNRPRLADISNAQPVALQQPPQQQVVVAQPLPVPQHQLPPVPQQHQPPPLQQQQPPPMPQQQQPPPVPQQQQQQQVALQLQQAQPVAFQLPLLDFAPNPAFPYPQYRFGSLGLPLSTITTPLPPYAGEAVQDFLPEGWWVQDYTGPNNPPWEGGPPTVGRRSRHRGRNTQSANVLGCSCGRCHGELHTLYNCCGMNEFRCPARLMDYARWKPTQGV
jgi:hypothetical protein